jgi:flagellar biosynthesis protein FlhA
MPLPVVTFDADLEGLLNQAVRANPKANWPFDAELAQRIIRSVNEAVETTMLAARAFSVVTAPACRAPLARLLRTQLPDVPVLSFLEIPENKAVNVIAIVGMPTSEADSPTTENADLNTPQLGEKR